MNDVHQPINDERQLGFDAFYRKALESVLSKMMIITRDQQLAEDVSQDAFAEMWRHWGERQTWSYDRQIAYTIGIATKTVASLRRFSIKRRIGEAQTWWGADRRVWHVEISVLASEALAILYRLPLRERAVAVLFFQLDMSFADIADILGIAESTVRTNIQRVRKKVQVALSDSQSEAVDREGSGR